MNSQTNRDENGSGKRVFSMRFVLASTFGALVALSVGIVLFMSVDSNLNNTFSLLNERAESLITGMEDEIRQETGRTELSVQTFASLYANGTIENLEQAEVEPVFRTILTTEPAVEALFLYRTDGTLLYLRRDPEDKIESFSPNWFSSEAKASLVDQLTGNFDEPKWGQPVKIGPVLFNFVFLPLVRDGQNNGYIVAAVGRYVVNRIIARIGRSNFTTAFVLDANNNVIAYSADPELLRGRSDYPLAEFPDKTLADYLNAESTDRFRKALRSGILVKETEGRQGYVYITKTLAGASGNPYTLGAYFKKSDIGAEVFRAIRTFFVGILGLLVAVLVAFLLGRRISLPMVAIAKTARQLSAFDIDGLKPLPGSRIREINDQAEALNNVRRAMREFARYVPRPLVARLIRSGVDRIPTVEREITIMFSDIVGFTSLSEHMNAADTARILNDFFEMQCQEIEASKGT
ncbi:MAG: adenylate/guanylate cyclase domain-containing protein, partial [Pseudomonadota bacterium]